MMIDTERSAARVLGVILLVAIVVILSVSITTFVLLIGDSLSDPAPTATFETETTEAGTVIFRHVDGETIEAENIEINGGVIRGDMPKSIEAGTSIEVAPSDDTTGIAWNSDVNSAVLKRVETSPNPLSATGVSEVWHTDTRYGGEVRDMIATDKYLYIADDNDIAAIDPDTGNEVWRSGAVSGPRSISESNGVVYGGTKKNSFVDAEVVAIDGSTGSKIWSHKAHKKYDEHVVGVEVYNGVVYSINEGNPTHNGHVIATNASNGNVIWESALRTGRSQDLHVSDGIVYTGYEALNASDGSTIWSQDDDYFVITDIDGSDGELYIATSGSGGTVAALDADDGSTIWEKQIGSDGIGGVAKTMYESEGVLYTSNNQNQVKALDSKDGSILWKHNLHSNAPVALVEHDGIVYSGDDYQTIRAVELEYGD